MGCYDSFLWSCIAMVYCEFLYFYLFPSYGLYIIWHWLLYGWHTVQDKPTSKFNGKRRSICLVELGSGVKLSTHAPHPKLWIHPCYELCTTFCSGDSHRATLEKFIRIGLWHLKCGDCSEYWIQGLIRAQIGSLTAILYIFGGRNSHLDKISFTSE